MCKNARKEKFMKNKNIKLLLLCTVLTCITPQHIMADTTTDLTNEHLTESVSVPVTSDQQTTVTVTLPEGLTLDKNGTASYEINAKGCITNQQRVTVTPSETFDVTDGNKSITVFSTQGKQSWKSDDLLQEDGTSSSGYIKTAKPLSAGKYTGNLIFNIEIEDIVSPNKCNVVIMDDDGTKGCETTGFSKWCNDQNIPITFSVPTNLIGSDNNFYNIKELHELETSGNEIVCHSTDFTNGQDAYDAGTLDTTLQNAKFWMQSNDFNSSIYIYPDGNYGPNYKEIRDTIGKYFSYGCTVNGLEANTLDEYKSDWTTTSGFYNTINSDQLNICRVEMTSTNELNSNSWYKPLLQKCIDTNGLLVLFVHSGNNDFTTNGGIDVAKETIEWLKSNDNVQFVTLSNGLNQYY